MSLMTLVAILSLNEIIHKCYTCTYYKRYKLGCYDVCEHDYIMNGGFAKDIPHDKGKTCNKFLEKT